MAHRTIAVHLGGAARAAGCAGSCIRLPIAEAGGLAFFRYDFPRKQANMKRSGIDI